MNLDTHVYLVTTAAAIAASALLVTNPISEVDGTKQVHLLQMKRSVDPSPQGLMRREAPTSNGVTLRVSSGIGLQAPAQWPAPSPVRLMLARGDAP